MLSGLKVKSLPSWLDKSVTKTIDMQYRHTLLKEDTSFREDAISELKNVIKAAHDDARMHISKALFDPLDPIENEIVDPLGVYPSIFDMTTLKGYFGEIFSGLVAENCSPFEEDNWQVPAFSFRCHETALDQLEMYRQTGQMTGAIVGRTGDDALAFVLDGDKITKILFIEAKCTASHRASMIAEAHTKISSSNLIPVEIRRLIEILRDYEHSNATATVWVTALRRLFRSSLEGTLKHERYDLVSYVCGQFPVRSSSWISKDKPHENYSGNRKLETVETHLSDVEGLISQLYEG